MKQFASTESIRCAVIGYGGAFNMGRSHLREMAATGMQPVGVAEIDPERLSVASQDFPGIGQFREVASLLREARPDLVAIITPHNTHAELALQCLEGGAAVVCEKPMALTVAECDQMIAKANEKNLLLSVYHNRHWDGCILEARERIVDKGEIGRVFRMEAQWGGFAHPRDWWRSSQRISGGVHYDWGVHLLEYAFQLIGSEAVEVSAMTARGHWETAWGADTNDDELSAMVRFANGVLLNLRVTHVDADPEPSLLVATGTAGKYYMGMQQFRMVIPEGDERVQRSGPNRSSESARYYRNIAEAMTGQADLVITPQWSRQTIEVLEAATRSAATGRAVSLDTGEKK